MVVFKEGGFSIEIKTGTNPVEDWLALQTELLSILATINADDIIEHWRTIGLVSNMLPDYETAMKMFPRPTK